MTTVVYFCSNEYVILHIVTNFDEKIREYSKHNTLNIQRGATIVTHLGRLASRNRNKEEREREMGKQHE